MLGDLGAMKWLRCSGGLLIVGMKSNHGRFLRGYNDLGLHSLKEPLSAKAVLYH